MARRPIGASRARAGRWDPAGLTLLRRELRRDRASEDRTSRALVPPGARGVAEIVAQRAGTVSGLRASVELARSLGLRAVAFVRDGDRIRPGAPVLRLTGELRRILGVERTILNALMHLSGIATATARAVREVEGVGGDVAIYATRKTLPGLRELQKAAVVHGGGHPHRMDLSDGILVKPPHLAMVGIPEAIVRLRRGRGRHRPVQVEVHDLDGARAAIRAGADALLLDNRSARASARILRTLSKEGLRGRVWVELSGGLRPGHLAAYARTGADALSLGSLTHSAPALPFHLRLRRRVPSARL